jgi:hypothetical protein
VRVRKAIFVLIDNRNVKIIGASLQKSPADPLNHLDLMPGINKVSDADWATVKDRPFMKSYLKEGSVAVVDAKSDTIKGYAPEKAFQIIERTANKQLLREWSKEKDLDADVYEAIDEQIDKLKIEKAA